MSIDPIQRPSDEPEHLAVVIVGAGLSGIGAADHLSTRMPRSSYAILEARESIGGTWDLFRYPGIRSDSDMHTLGYRMRPWRGAKAIADGPSILSYIRDTAKQTGAACKVRFRHRVLAARWSSEQARWSLEVAVGESGETVAMTCSFLLMCSGYYRYDEGYTPQFEGIEGFAGRVVHPQHWPEDLDYEGTRVVVIGSGATAVTLVPAMAARAAHVTMLQRTPTYIVSVPAHDPIEKRLRRMLPPRALCAAIRWKNVLVQSAVYRLSRRRPALVKRLLRFALERQLPAGYDIDTHFSPPYAPWDERLCVVPDGDMFAAIRSGRASIVTDRIARFTERGIALESGEQLEADVVVTATGLNLLAFGGVQLCVDGREVELSETMAYKGMMLSGVPNFAFTIGYTNASWTLKADLVAEYVCRLLARMEREGHELCVPEDRDPSVERRPLLDFASGYVQRSVDSFPRQGSRAPWTLAMSYPHDLLKLRHGSLEDHAMRFARRPCAVERREHHAIALAA